MDLNTIEMEIAEITMIAGIIAFIYLALGILVFDRNNEKKSKS